MPDPSVTILLCTHNGARHLPAQLESIAGQCLRDWALWVSDDGSSDASWALLERFRAAHPDREVRLLRGAQKGAAANYLSLVCHPELGARRIAFCDQDDVWLPRKLARACSVLDDTPAAAPHVYAAASIVTDAELGEIGRIPVAPCGGSFRNALVQNVLHGSTMVMSPAAHALLRRAGRPDVPYHDWWSYLVLTGCGAGLLLDPEPALKYRQHGQNEIGYNRSTGATRSRAALIRQGTYRDWLTRNVQALLDADLPLMPERRAMAETFLALQNQRGLSRAAGYRALGLHRQSRASTAVLQACACLGYA